MEVRMLFQGIDFASTRAHSVYTMVKISLSQTILPFSMTKIVSTPQLQRAREQENRKAMETLSCQEPSTDDELLQLSCM